MRKALYVMVAVAVLGMLAAYGYGGGADRPAVTVTPAPSLAASVVPNESVTPSAAAAVYKDGSYIGDAATNRFESVTVTITVSGGRITAADAAISFTDSKSQPYVDISLPTLKSETLTAQSASIDGVSGATYTSDSYIQSLQSAIDKARS